MAMAELGTQELTDEDRGYSGSRFREVVDALFANPYQRVWGGEGEAPLPVYKVSLGSLLWGRLFNATARPHAIAIARRQALSHHGPEPHHRPANGELHHAGRHWRSTHRVHQRRRIAKRSGYDGVAPRQWRADPAVCRLDISSRRQPADNPPVVSNRGARDTGGPADAGAGVHAAARCARPAEDRRRGARFS